MIRQIVFQIRDKLSEKGYSVGECRLGAEEFKDNQLVSASSFKAYKARLMSCSELILFNKLFC